MLDDNNDLETVFRSPASRPCQERSLVLHAVGITHALVDTGQEYRLVVNIDDADHAREQIDLYVRENRGWPPRLPETMRRPGGPLGVLAYVGILLAFAWLQTHDFAGMDWTAAGRLDGAQIRAGQWWRVVTALTLHADLSHLVGNLVIGAAFGLFASNLMGAGFGWTTILVAGAFGNALNAFVQPTWHRSIGASTAIFAALGLVSAYLWKERQVLGHRGAQLWAPVVAGAVLLTWFGTGGERTDIVAHLTGFVAGAAAGLIFGGRAGELVPGNAGQLLFGLAGIALTVGAWAFALSAAG